VRTSPVRNAAYNLRCKTEKFEAILFPRCSRCRCLRTADRCSPVLEAVEVHPKCAKSSSGVHARPSHTKADTPRCSAISLSYCRRPRPASCTPSWCHRQRHRHCLYRARWRIDRPSRRAHPRRCAGFDSREEASLWIPETAQHSKEFFVTGGVPHPRNLISYPSIDKRRPTSP
jgi:hypothetical protein